MCDGWLLGLAQATSTPVKMGHAAIAVMQVSRHHLPTFLLFLSPTHTFKRLYYCYLSCPNTQLVISRTHFSFLYVCLSCQAHT